MVLFRETTKKENPRSTINEKKTTLSTWGGKHPRAGSPCVNDVSQKHDSGIEEAEILTNWFNRIGEEMENEWMLDFDQRLRLGAVPSGSEFSLDDVSDDELDGSESQRLEKARIDFEFD